MIWVRLYMCLGKDIYVFGEGTAQESIKGGLSVDCGYEYETDWIRADRRKIFQTKKRLNFPSLVGKK